MGPEGRNRHRFPQRHGGFRAGPPAPGAHGYLPAVHERLPLVPKNILVVSDLEFNSPYGGIGCNSDETLFDVIEKKYKDAGYTLPKLIFWNVNSRTNTIPVTENKAGVILLSGFSKSLMEMVMSTEIDPYKALVKILNVERYSVIEKLFSENA